jgi:hypothetical protein
MSDVVAYLTNYGAVGVVLILIIAGVLVPRPMYTDKKEEAAEYKRALEAERARADAAVTAAAATRDLLLALRGEVHERT